MEIESEEPYENEVFQNSSLEGASKASLSNGLRRRSSHRSIKKSESHSEDPEGQTVQPVGTLTLDCYVSTVTLLRITGFFSCIWASNG